MNIRIPRPAPIGVTVVAVISAGVVAVAAATRPTAPGSSKDAGKVVRLKDARLKFESTPPTVTPACSCSSTPTSGST